MKRLFYLITLSTLSLTLCSCSNIEMGFDEDSVFHSKEKEESQNVVETKSDTKEDNKKEEIKEVESETTFSYDSQAGYE